MVTRTCFLLILIISGCSVLKKNPTKGNPPGTLKINDTLFIDQTEIANVYWREYLYYLSDLKKDDVMYQKALPDTLVWRDLLRYCEPLVENYFRHPSFNNYPVVGVSYDQAIEFCKWRTFAANFGSYVDENHITDNKQHFNDSFPIKYYYRLPTKEEWELIANGNLSPNQYPYGYDTVYKKWKVKYQKIFNCAYPNKSAADSAVNIQYYTADIKSFYPNSSGCYNMIGNVAELVSEKGIAKGGSFMHSLDSCKISIDLHYEKPEVWLGFRCVAVKIK